MTKQEFIQRFVLSLVASGIDPGGWTNLPVEVLRIQAAQRQWQALRDAENTK